MPIRPENKARYPANWKEIRKEILERAKNSCEGCGLDNHAWVIRGNAFYCQERPGQNDNIISIIKKTAIKWRRVMVVLTIAHLDHTPENCHPDNLKAWCQKCHNKYDAPVRAQNRKIRIQK